MSEYLKWAAIRVPCWELPTVLEKLNMNGCEIQEVWKYAYEAIVLYQDRGKYPSGLNPATNEVMK